MKKWNGYELWEEKLDRYDWRTIKAVREHKKGRARGGTMLTVRKLWKAEKKVRMEGETGGSAGSKVWEEKGKMAIILVSTV